jgi:hypothetical protein
VKLFAEHFHFIATAARRGDYFDAGCGLVLAVTVLPLAFAIYAPIWLLGRYVTGFLRTGGDGGAR